MAAITSLFFYALAFAVLCLVALATFTAAERTRQARTPPTESYRHFQFWFLIGWGICVAADWLQGPYLYVLYSAYGYPPKVIAHLFLAGFVVSGVAGSFIGRVADRYGRRNACQAYCVLYILACLTKHFNSYGVLMIGRILGGCATSLLFSVFESWVVAEMMQNHKVDGSEIHHLLGRMYFVSYSAAILAGLASQGLTALAALTEVTAAPAMYWGGPTLPYDASIVSLIAGAVIIHFKWAENYGERHAPVGCNRLPKDWLVWAIGLVAACFESAMYIFVFSFTPALHGAPMGVVSSLFMLASMSGASATEVFTWCGIRPQGMLPWVLLLAGVSLAAAAACGFVFLITLVACLLFEASVGIYWPAIATLKAQVVAEELRAHVYNLYRIPLNLIVVIALAPGPSATACFYSAAALLILGSALSACVAVARARRSDMRSATLVLTENLESQG